ncbi:MAG: type IV secretion system DNA-binding domain-containing protein [Pseudomonadota bacterium]|nr:type IV secretion system DNA-binding domain-containing protein [Pseudomonadota bacterium]
MGEIGGGKRAWIAPSIKTRDVGGWVRASVLAGAIAGAMTLWAVWRPLPWLPIPDGALSTHASYWAKHWAAPGIFEEAFRRYSTFWEAIGDSGRGQIEWRAACALGMFTAPFALFAKGWLTPQNGLTLLRGGERHEGEDAARALRKKFAKASRENPDHEIAPGIPWPAEMWTRHAFLVGGVGSGKSTVMRPLIKKIVDSGEQALIFDPKSEFTARFPQPSIVAPWDRRSVAWDIAKDMRNLLDMRRFAAAIIGESHDPMWSNASRQLLVGLLAHLNATMGEDWGWADLAKLVALPQEPMLAIMKARHPEAVRAVERASATSTGVLINLSAFCSSIFDLASAWGDAPKDRRISMVEWTEGRSSHKQLILQGHGAYEELTKSYVSAMVGVFAALVNSVEMEDDDSRKVWFLADEFAQMGKLPVRPLFEVGRSRGVRCVVACQDFAQLDELYGEKAVQAMIAMCGVLIIGQTMPGETAESLCRALGSREYERRNVSVSRTGAGESASVSYSREVVPLYSPFELARLGRTRDRNGVKMIVFTHGDAHELVWPLVAYPRRRRPFKPAKWTLRTPQDVVGAQSATEPDATGVALAQEHVDALLADLGDTADQQ